MDSSPAPKTWNPVIPLRDTKASPNFFPFLILTSLPLSHYYSLLILGLGALLLVSFNFFSHAGLSTVLLSERLRDFRLIPRYPSTLSTLPLLE